MKTLRGFLADSARDAIGPQASAVERLVGVDVADARDRALVEQHRLQCRAPFPQAAVELVRHEGGVDRLRAEVWHLLRGQQRGLGPEKQPAEATRVAVAQLDR